MRVPCPCHASRGERDPLCQSGHVERARDVTSASSTNLIIAGATDAVLERNAAMQATDPGEAGQESRSHEDVIMRAEQRKEVAEVVKAAVRAKSERSEEVRLLDEQHTGRHVVKLWEEGSNL